MNLYNTLSRKIEEFTPLDGKSARIYSCGPTVYDHVHIGNLSAFIIADTLSRLVKQQFPGSRQVMNLTDVDDKTIKKAAVENAGIPANEALSATTSKYADVFFSDMRAVGNDVDSIEFVRATDPQTIDDIRSLITELHNNGFAYIASDGVYFSIDAYRKSGKHYGQLVELGNDSASSERIQNDEYDKESIHDFALWKTVKENEPSWEFLLNGSNMRGRPGWHIECSAMSARALGQPFDIHTGGVDLKFPHHENEIAQSTAGKTDKTYAKWFVHNDHILVDGKKMAKSAGNFHTLIDLAEKEINPLAFRLLVLQSHYRSPTQFSWQNAVAAQNRLNNWRNVAALRHQTHDTLRDDSERSTSERDVSLLATRQAIYETLNNDLNTPAVLTTIDEAFDKLDNKRLDNIHQHSLVQLLETVDDLLGLQLLTTTPDITDEQKQLILERQRARDEKNWAMSDKLREELLLTGIAVRDTDYGPIWSYA